nr:hypothetical protein [Tanacetum cinerariifolium]
MTDLCPLNYFLSISVTRDSTGLFVSQKKYVIEILDKAHMVICNLIRTPINTESKLRSDGDPIPDPTMYRSLTGSLQYLTFTRSDISYAVQHVLHLFSFTTTDLDAYSDADWAGFPTTHRSTSEAEYHGVANAVAETCWLRNLLCEFHCHLSFATLVYCNNVYISRIDELVNGYWCVDGLVVATIVSGDGWVDGLWRRWWVRLVVSTVVDRAGGSGRWT